MYGSFTFEISNQINDVIVDFFYYMFGTACDYCMSYFATEQLCSNVVLKGNFEICESGCYLKFWI